MQMGHPPHHLGVRQNIRPTDLEDASFGLLGLKDPDEIANDIRQRNRLRAGRRPLRHHHRWKMGDELPGDFPGNAAVPDDDSGPEHGDRDTTARQQVLNLSPGLQMRGQVRIVAAQAAEIDHPLETRIRCRPSECEGSLGVFLGKVRLRQRVH
jgi:hypothetical protein